jgi:hypothetical protein
MPTPAVQRAGRCVLANNALMRRGICSKSPVTTAKPRPVAAPVASMISSVPPIAIVRWLRAQVWRDVGVLRIESACITDSSDRRRSVDEIENPEPIRASMSTAVDGGKVAVPVHYPAAGQRYFDRLVLQGSGDRCRATFRAGIRNQRSSSQRRERRSTVWWWRKISIELPYLSDADQCFVEPQPNEV